MRLLDLDEVIRRTCFKPVKSTLAVLKHNLLLVFAKHFGFHSLKDIAVQQSLANKHHFVP